MVMLSARCPLSVTQVITIRPRNPQANGAAENKVKIIKGLLKRAKMNIPIGIGKRDAWATHMPNAVRQYNEAHSKFRGTVRSVAEAVVPSPHVLSRWRARTRAQSPHQLALGRLPPSRMHDMMEVAGVDVDSISEIEDQNERLAALHEVCDSARRALSFSFCAQLSLAAQGMKRASIEQRSIEGMLHNIVDGVGGGDAEDAVEHEVNTCLADWAANIEGEVQALEKQMVGKQASRAAQWQVCFKSMSHSTTSI